MKKMIMGIATMMMVFGTMTMNANNATKNDKNNHGHNTTAVNNHGKGHDKGHNDKGHNDGWGHNNKNTYHMGHGMNNHHTYHNNAWFKNYHMGHVGRNYINVFHCMAGYKVMAKPHHHVYAHEMVNGRYTGHMICIHCAKHMH